MHTSDRLPTAQALIARWNEQQTGYIRHRAERFATIARVVSACCRNTETPRILDLAAGPGSLGYEILEVVPNATLVTADKDPALLAIAADLTQSDDRVTTLNVDLSDDAWAQNPVLTAAPFDAVVSSTALHWLHPAPLVNVYRNLVHLIRPGGIFLNGDHLKYDAITSPVLREIALLDDKEMQEATFGTGTPDWDAWWQAVRETGQYTVELAERENVWAGKMSSPPLVTLGFHLETLRSAGFVETGTLWQYLDDFVLYGIR